MPASTTAVWKSVGLYFVLDIPLDTRLPRHAEPRLGLIYLVL